MPKRATIAVADLAAKVDLGPTATDETPGTTDEPFLRIELAPLERLKPYARNARTHSPEQIAKISASMVEFGWTMPALVNENDDLIAGHGRILAAAEVYEAGGLLRMASGAPIPVGFVPYLVARGWTDAQRRAYIIADNRLPEDAGWDDALLRLELGELGGQIDLALTGFTPTELDLLFVDVGAGEPNLVVPPPAVAVSRLGDLWTLGRHRLLCGDSTAPDAVARVLAGGKPNLMVTDPPYGVKYDPAWRVETGHGSYRQTPDGPGQAIGEVLNDDRADWREAWALFPGNVAYIWHAGTYCGDVANSLVACRFKIRAHIVWVKQRHVFGRGDYHFQHEPCFYAVREEAEEDWHFVAEHELAVYAVREGARGEFDGGRKQSTVWNIEHIKSATGHGTQKPVECMRRPIENNSKPGDEVYEPFSGSGTTIIACDITKRFCRAIELHPAYVDVAIKRWQEFTAKKALLNGVPFDQVALERGVLVA